MGKKWYSYFVVADEPATAAGASPVEAPVEPRRASDVAPESGDPIAVPDAASPAVDLTDVYATAKIVPPAHGYTVLKVAEMLQSEHIRTLPADVKRKSVMVALDAAGVKVDEIVEDAVRRDRALDTYERVLQQHADQAAAKTTAENQQLEEEIARQAAALRARIDENNRQVAAEQTELLAWRVRKRQEEAMIAEAIGYFVSENPVSTTPRNESGQGDSNVR